MSRFVYIGPSKRDSSIDGIYRHKLTQEYLQNRLLQLPFVTAAYLKPTGSDPVLDMPSIQTSDAALTTPLFVSEQLHLNGPGGFNVSAISSQKGGRGEEVTVIDIERGWSFNHEDLVQSKGEIVVGNLIAGDVNHGTAVVGVIAGNDNKFGITGIAPKAKLLGASYVEETSLPNLPKTILGAASSVKAGDIMLIEIHYPGPRCNFSSCGGQKGFIAMEYWPDNFHALKVATDMGIIIFEAAGNGFENLDDPIYSVTPKGFPADWKNPFDRSLADSGCILVGAGSPPPGFIVQIMDLIVPD